MRITIHTGLGPGVWGLGHGVRMRALASALTAQGAAVSFFTSTPALAEFVAPLPCVLLPDTWACGMPDCDVLVEDVPSSVTASHWWYTRLREQMRVVRVDVPTASPETCDILLSPGAHWHPDTVTGLRTAFGPRFLYGWDYVLLEDTVTQFPRIPYAPRADGPLVLCAGGSDPAGALATMASWLGSLVKKRRWVALVPAYGEPIALPVWVRAEPFSRSWLRRAALVVTTWGVTVYEALWWGTPVLTTASSQPTLADALRLADASHHALAYLGHPETVYPEAMATAIACFSKNRVLRTLMSSASTGLLDGLGAARAASAILALERM